jgi:DNA repair exonuclease SbcCD ATPase subunit
LTSEDLRVLREEFEKILPNPTPEELRELEGLLEDLQRSLADYDRETAMRVALEDVRHLAKMLLEKRLAAPPAPSGVCPVCGKPVTKGVDVWTEYAGQLYHWPCFEKVRPKLLGWA